MGQYSPLVTNHGRQCFCESLERQKRLLVCGDGSVVVWGHAENGGDAAAVQHRLKNVEKIQSTTEAYAAILADGSVVTWGQDDTGGDSRDVQHQLKNVQCIQASSGAFAAILADRSVVNWGSPVDGGDSSAVQQQLINVREIQASFSAFAAIRFDGSVVTWGHARSGGRSVHVQDELMDVRGCLSTEHGFIAMCDSSIVSWGDRGSSNEKLEARKKVKQIQASEHAVAATLEDGSVQVWPADTIEDKADQLQNVQHIQAAVARGFAAILADGTGRLGP